MQVPPYWTKLSGIAVMLNVVVCSLVLWREHDVIFAGVFWGPGARDFIFMCVKIALGVVLFVLIKNWNQSTNIHRYECVFYWLFAEVRNAIFMFINVLCCYVGYVYYKQTERWL